MFPKTLRGSLKLTFSNSLNTQPKPCPVVCSVPSISLNFFVFFSRNLKEKSCVYSSPFLVAVQSLKLLVALRFSNKQQTVLSFFFWAFSWKLYYCPFLSSNFLCRILFILCFIDFSSYCEKGFVILRKRPELKTSSNFSQIELEWCWNLNWISSGSNWYLHS